MKALNYKILKKPLCCLVILCLLLQFAPSSQPAQAKGLFDILKRIFSKLTVPDEIKITDTGDVMLGNNIKLFVCIYKNKQNECANPASDFDAILFGKQPEHYTIKPDGTLNKATPKIPEVCQLHLLRPVEKGGENLTEDEQMARRRACNYLIRLQEAASQEAFTAKSIFVKTDPKSDCLFLKNCRSKCSLRFGEVKYVITIFDIAEFLLPTGWVSFLHKIVNALAMLGEIKNVYDAAKTLLQDGLNLVNNLLTTFNYLTNLYKSLDNLGGSLAAGLGVGALVTAATGIDIPGGNWTVGVAAGVAGGAALGGMKEMLGRFSDNMLAYGQAKSQANNLILGIRKDIIDIMEGKQGLNGIKKEPELAFLFKPQTDDDRKKKKELDEIITNHRSFFENSTSLLKRISLPGELIGETVLDVHTGTNNEWIYSKEVEMHPFRSADALSLQENRNVIVDTIYGEQEFTPNYCSGCRPSTEIVTVFNPDKKGLLAQPNNSQLVVEMTEPQYIKDLIDEVLGIKQGDPTSYKDCFLDGSKDKWRRGYWEKLGRIILGDVEVDGIIAQDCDLESKLDCNLLKVSDAIVKKRDVANNTPFSFLEPLRKPMTEMFFIDLCNKGMRTEVRTNLIDAQYTPLKDSSGLFIKQEVGTTSCKNLCIFPGDRVVPWQSNCPEGTGIESLPADKQHLKDLTEPTKVEFVLEQALGGITNDHYNYDVLNYSKGSWQNYWEEIGRVVLAPGRVEQILNEFNRMETRHRTIMAECINVYPFLEYLRALEGKGYASDLAVGKVNEKIEVFTIARQQSSVFPAVCESSEVGPSHSWFTTFQEAYAGIDGLAAFFKSTSPGYLESWLPTILNCYQTTGNCELDYKNDKWRSYWERLATYLYGWNEVKRVMNTYNMQRTHEKLQEDCIDEYEPLRLLRGLELRINSANEGWSNTKTLIDVVLSDYRSAREGVSLEAIASSSIYPVLGKIVQLGYHEQDLELYKHTPERYISSNDLYPNGVYAKYWQSTAWCDNDCFLQARDKFLLSYDSGLAEMEWEARIKAILHSPKDILFVLEAIRVGLTPEEPLINYKMEKASQDFIKAVQDTQAKLEPIVNGLTESDACNLAVRFYYSLERYINHPDEQWDGCPSDGNYCCNISDCRQKMENALSSCGWGTPNSPEEWQEFSIRAYQRYRMVFSPWYWRFGDSQYANHLGFLQNIKTLIRALDFVWQNDLTAENEGECFNRQQLENILNTLNWGGSWIMSVIDSYISGIQPDSTDDSGIVKKFVANILITRLLSQQIPVNLAYIKNSLKSDEIIQLYPVDELLEKIGSWPLDQAVKDELLDTVESEFGTALEKMKEEIITRLENSIGKYMLSDNWWVQYSVLEGHTEEELCPTGIEKQGFLSRLSCFEKINSKTFDDIMRPLNAMEKLEHAIFLLTDANSEINGISSVKQSVEQLQPSIRTEVLQINTELVQDLEDKFTDPLKRAWNTYNPFSKGGISEDTSGPVQIFEDNNTKLKSWKDFKKAIADNPISALEDDFKNIDQNLQGIFNDLQSAIDNLSGFWGWQYDNPRFIPYRDAINTVNYDSSRMPRVSLLVFGNQKNQNVCEGLSTMLGSALPVEMRNMCQTVSSGGRRNPAVLQDQALVSQCEALENIVSRETEITPEQIPKRVADLEQQRSCITKESCDNGSSPCLVCPQWFCLNPTTGAWGAEAIQKDPVCQDLCRDWRPSQNTDYVCDSGLDIIWNTAVHGALVSCNPTREICEGLGFDVGTCTKEKVNTRCQLINDFLKGSDCNLFDSCSPEELQRQLDIQKWRQQSTANQCPKWFCLNTQGNWQGSVGVSSDSYCQAHCGANDKQGDGMVCNVSTGIIWDTSIHPIVGDQIWPPKNVSDVRANQMVLKCVEAQQGLQNLGALDLAPTDQTKPDCSLLQPIISFCQHRIPCGQMQNACAVWNVQQQGCLSDKPPMQWPPDTRCPGKTGFAQKYQGAQNLCIQTQKELESLKGLKDLSPEQISQLLSGEKCNELEYQVSLEKECNSFAIAEKAVKNECNNLSGENKQKCQNLLSQAKQQLCDYNKIQCDNFPNGFPDISSSTTENQKALEKVKDLCFVVDDIKTPLNEIMKVFSVLIGIRSGTLAFGSIKTSVADAKKIMENIQKFIKMIEELPKKMKTAWEGTNKKSIQGGLKITPLACEAKPAVSMASGREVTGPAGGPVCPEVGALYKQVQGQFSIIRQNLHQIDLARRQVQEIIVPLWKKEKFIHIFNVYPIRYLSIDPLYQRAESIKQKAQYIWTLATAIDFANAQCTCGISFCKLPFCISGLPLTLEPLKQPYCALVWILRTPMAGLIESLNDELEALPDNLTK